MDRYTITELEKLTGIRAGTIRIWERRYRIIKPHRTDTNRRWYDDDDLVRIINISIPVSCTHLTLPTNREV
mgnify:CR=1 FL=1